MLISGPVFVTGAQIILSMKIIGVGFDHSNGNVEKLPDVTQFLGYCLNVGSVIFGPWVSYQDYLQAVKLDYKALVNTECFWGGFVQGSTCINHGCGGAGALQFYWL